MYNEPTYVLYIVCSKTFDVAKKNLFDELPERTKIYKHFAKVFMKESLFASSFSEHFDCWECLQIIYGAQQSL